MSKIIPIHVQYLIYAAQCWQILLKSSVFKDFGLTIKHSKQIYKYLYSLAFFILSNTKTTQYKYLAIVVDIRRSWNRVGMRPGLIFGWTNWEHCETENMVRKFFLAYYA